MENELKKLNEYLKLFMPDFKPQMNHPLSEKEILAFEEEHEIKLPKDLRIYFKWINESIEGFQNKLINNKYFISLKSSLDRRLELINIFDKNYDDSLYWSDEWIPIMESGGGDYYCYDLAENKIIKFYHDGDQSIYISKSLKDFIMKISEPYEELMDIKTNPRVVTQDEFNLIYEEHQKWLKNKQGKQADFSNRLLINIIFPLDGNLEKAIFENCEIKRSKINLANIKFTTIKRLNLFETNFKGATIKDLHLGGSNIKKADFSNSIMENCRLDYIKASEVKFDNSRLINIKIKSSWITGNWKCCSFIGTVIKKSVINFDSTQGNFNHSVFEDCLLRKVTMKTVNFDNSKFYNSNFSKSNLTKSSFKNTSFKNVSFKETNLKSTNFENSDIDSQTTFS